LPGAPSIFDGAAESDLAGPVDCDSFFPPGACAAANVIETSRAAAVVEARSECLKVSSLGIQHGPGGKPKKITPVPGNSKDHQKG
jgi:hypothetical protein